jgi:predicted 2-oxoglutarate/Fe(II)-dependent dioxygenase YbiX/peroxiredoxin
VPDFVLPDAIGQPTSLLVHSRGKPMVLVFCERDHDRNLAPFVAAAGRLALADPFVVTRLAPDANLALAERAKIPWGVLGDATGAVGARYGFAGLGQPVPALTTYTLDPGLRVLHVDRGGDPHTHLANAIAAIAEVAPLAPLRERRGVVPVLTIPRVIDPAACAELIRWWHERGTHRSGTIDAFANRQIESGYSEASKKRRDHDVADPALIARLNDVMQRRVFPEVAKTFQYRATRTTGYKIACYLDPQAEGGYFRAHRDNIAPMSAHRRFAVSLLLNPAADYAGGALHFPEYGPEAFKPEAGEALVFSCSLLHEVTEVTRGQRFVLLTFLTDDATLAATERVQPGRDRP